MGVKTTPKWCGVGRWVRLRLGSQNMLVVDVFSPVPVVMCAWKTLGRVIEGPVPIADLEPAQKQAEK